MNQGQQQQPQQSGYNTEYNNNPNYNVYQQGTGSNYDNNGNLYASPASGGRQPPQQQYVQNGPPQRNSGKKKGTVKKLAKIFQLTPNSREEAVKEFNQTDSSRLAAQGYNYPQTDQPSQQQIMQMQMQMQHSQHSQQHKNQMSYNQNNMSYNQNQMQQQPVLGQQTNDVQMEIMRSQSRSLSRASSSNVRSVSFDESTNENMRSKSFDNSTTVGSVSKAKSEATEATANVDNRTVGTYNTEPVKKETVNDDSTVAGGFECSIDHFTRALCGDPDNVSFEQVNLDRDDATVATGVSEVRDDVRDGTIPEVDNSLSRQESVGSRSRSRSRPTSPMRFFRRSKSPEVSKQDIKKDVVPLAKSDIQVNTSRNPYGDDVTVTEASIIEFNENQDYALAAGLQFNPRIGGDLQSGITPRYQRSAFDPFYDIRSNDDILGIMPYKTNISSLEVREINDEREEVDDQLRTFARTLSPRWGQDDLVASSVARRLRDFQFAREKRRQLNGKHGAVGILGLYDYLAGVRLDVEWAEDAAWRRWNNKPYLSWTDFEKKKNSGFNQPFFTYFLVMISSVMLIVSVGKNGWIVEAISSNPMIGPSVDTLLNLGAKESNLIVNEGEGWRIIAPMFLHAGFIHYAINMLALWFIGSAVEKIHGTIAITIIFLISAIGGTLLSAVFLPEFVTVGASGGIFGLVGACMADISLNWSMLFSDYLDAEEGGTKLKHWKVLSWLLFDIFINCLVGLTPFVDNFTHMGGMVVGFMCGLSTMERLDKEFFGLEQSCIMKTRQLATRFFGLILSITFICIISIVLLEGDGVTSPCSNCRYASCVPFPPWESDASKWWYCDDCDKVVGSATRNTQTGYYEQINLECPDGQPIAVTLEGGATTDSKSLLEDDLPYYCRDYCENIYA